MFLKNVFFIDATNNCFLTIDLIACANIYIFFEIANEIFNLRYIFLV